MEIAPRILAMNQQECERLFQQVLKHNSFEGTTDAVNGKPVFANSISCAEQ